MSEISGWSVTKVKSDNDDMDGDIIIRRAYNVYDLRTFWKNSKIRIDFIREEITYYLSDFAMKQVIMEPRIFDGIIFDNSLIYLDCSKHYVVYKTLFEERPITEGCIYIILCRRFSHIFASRDFHEQNRITQHSAIDVDEYSLRNCMPEIIESTRFLTTKKAV